MKVKSYLEKYINFSLISNCIVFNTLAGCKGKGNKGGKGCSGSGKDKNQSNTTGEGENELSPEEKARKKKEEEEKAKELAKDQAALDAKKQELIKVINALEPRITKLNTSEYNDLRINDIITKDQINLADTKTIADLEDKINKLNDKITENEKKLDKYEELKKKKEEEFYPRFNGLQEKMDIINSLNGCAIKVNTKIITKEMIDNSKYEDIASITQKLTDLETEINTKFTEVKDDLKKKNGEIAKQKSNNSNPLHDVFKVNYKDEQIDKCTFTNLVETYNDIKLNYDLSKLSSDDAKKYVKDEFKKIENLYKFFVGLNIETDSKKLKEEYAIVKKVDFFTDITQIKFLTCALISLKNIQNKISALNKTYNENYKKRYETAISTNNKLSINFIYETTMKDPLGDGDITTTVYNYTYNNIITTPGLINIDYTVTNEKTVDELNAIETNIKNLENTVTNNEAAFKENIKNTYNFFKNTYEDISDDIKNYKLTDDTLDGMIDSIKNLYELVRTEVQKLLKKAETISSAGVGITDEFKNKLKKLKLYEDSDDTKSIDPSCMEPNKFFNSENKNGDTIKEALKNLKAEIKKCDIVEQKKKILAKIKNLVDTYKKDITVDYILNNIVISKIQDKGTKDFYFYKDESSKEYETGEFDLTSGKFSVSDVKIIFPNEITADNLEFDKMKEIIENFELLFNHNAQIFKKIKEYFSKCQIKDFVGDIDLEIILEENIFEKKEWNKHTFRDIKDIKIEEYFKNYLNIDLYCSIYSTKNHKTLVEFENLVKELPDILSHCYFRKGDKFNFCKDKNLSEYISIEMYFVLFNPDIFKLILSQFVLANYKRDFEIDKTEESVYNFNKSEFTDLYYKYILKEKGNLYMRYYCIVLKSNEIRNFANYYNYLKQIEPLLIRYRLLPKDFPDNFYFDKNNKNIYPENLIWS